MLFSPQIFFTELSINKKTNMVNHLNKNIILLINKKKKKIYNYLNQRNIEYKITIL